MVDKARDYESELRRVMNDLADTVAKASDSEILDDAREAGIDVTAEVTRVREILLIAVKHEKRRRAQQSYERETARLRSRRYSLPQSAHAQRALLAAFIAARPDLQATVTAQFRELSELGDSDVESSLKKLEDLGLLEGLFPRPDSE